jgi:MscS family membrane protein
MTLENFALRDKFLFNHKLGLRYETTPAQIRSVLAEVREMLRIHPPVDQSTARIRLTEFGASALTLEVFAYVIAADAPAFLALQEELLLGIMDIILAAGTGLAFPSQTMYVTRDKPQDPAQIESAAARVRQRRNEAYPVTTSPPPA